MAKKLLIVDDNAGSSELYQIRFETSKWEVSVAYSGEKALELLKTDYHPDAILLDLMLPGIQGDNLLKILRQDQKNNDIAIIILTAVSFNPRGQEEVERIAKLADDYLLKIEVTPGEIVKRVTELVKKKQAKKWSGILRKIN